MTLGQIQRRIQKEPGLMLYFSGEHCSLCHALRPKIATLFETAFPQIDALFIDAHTVPEISAHFGVFSVPTLLVFLDGRECIREGRAVSLGALRQKLERPYEMLFGS
jgi:thioredoxin 1